ncbi:MAG: AbrB family transcriptional regulator [Salinarimonas sp.]
MGKRAQQEAERRRSASEAADRRCRDGLSARFARPEVCRKLTERGYGRCLSLLDAERKACSRRPRIWIVNLAQVLIGCALGSRFTRSVVVRLRAFALFATLGTLTLIAFAAVLAWLIAAATGIAVPSLILAAAPGGVAEMSITAKVLSLDVPLVTAFHVVRIVLIVLLSEPLFVLGKRLAERRSRTKSVEPDDAGS